MTAPPTIIARIRELDREATPGPWHARQVNYEESEAQTIQRIGVTVGSNHEDFLFDVRTLWSAYSEPLQALSDARLIAEYRVLAVQAADALEDSRERERRLREALERARGMLTCDPVFDGCHVCIRCHCDVDAGGKVRALIDAALAAADGETGGGT